MGVGSYLVQQNQDIREKAFVWWGRRTPVPRGGGAEKDRVAQVVDKFKQAVQVYDSRHPLYDAQGIVDLNGDGVNDTLKDVEAMCWQNDKTACAREKVKVIIGNPPPVKKPDGKNFNGLPSHTNNWAVYRYTSAIWNWIIADYHRFGYENSSDDAERAWHQERIIPHIYNTLLDLDILTTGPEHATPLSWLVDNENLEGSVYTLRDTYQQERYLSDATGIYVGIIKFDEDGLIPETYCTPLEKPYDEGKNCRTINLRERLKVVFSCLMAKNEINWMYDDENPGQLRKKYYDLDAVIAGTKTNPVPNAYTDYANGVGHLDLAGRTCHVLPENAGFLSIASWQPDGFFFNSQMVTMLFITSFFKDNFPGAYPPADLDKMITFAKNSVSHQLDINLENEGRTPGYFNDNYEFIGQNEYGYPTRNFYKNQKIGCDGNLVGNWSDPNKPPDCQGGTKELLGDGVINDQGGWQYLMQAMDALNWNWRGTPGGDTEIRKNLPFLRRNMLDTYTVDGQSMVILDPQDRYAGSYNQQLLEKFQAQHPDRKILGSCGQAGYNYVKTTGQYARSVINYQTGNEPLLVISSGVYAILKQLGAGEEANAIFSLTNKMLDVEIANPPDPRDTLDCWPGSGFTHQKNYAAEVGRQLAYLRTAYYYWQYYYDDVFGGRSSTMLPTMTSSPTTPPTQPPTDTPTATPTEFLSPTPPPGGLQIILNEATGQNCRDLCINLGRQCVSVGTDSEAANSRAYNYGLGGRCYTQYMGCGGLLILKGITCEGKRAMWTGCRCE